MSTIAAGPSRPLRPALLGRTFLHPLFDYLVIGGGLSLVAVAIVLSLPAEERGVMPQQLVYAILISNSAHFASSTVRLYTKPNAQRDLPFATLGLPLILFATLGLAMAYPGALGPHVNALYLTWSPYHYAAQAYGLAVMYAYRSGCQLSLVDKRWLRGASLVPFVFAFFGGRQTGLGWFVPHDVLRGEGIQQGIAIVQALCVALGFVAIAAVVFRQWRRDGVGLPVISILTMVANAVWFLVLPGDAFFWATIFHGLQYLAIVTIFHVKDHTKPKDVKAQKATQALRFYALSLGLGFALFHLVPQGFEVAGVGAVEAMLLTVAAINIHHFIVDGFIWKFKKGGGNRRIVDGAAPA